MAIKDFNNQTHERVLSLTEVAQIFGRSPKSIWRWHAKEGIFPQPIKLNGRTIGWRQSAIDAFLTAKAEEAMS